MRKLQLGDGEGPRGGAPRPQQVKEAFQPSTATRGMRLSRWPQMTPHRAQVPSPNGCLIESPSNKNHAVESHCVLGSSVGRLAIAKQTSKKSPLIEVIPGIVPWWWFSNCAL